MPIRRLARHLWWLAVMAGLLATTPALPAADSTQPARFLLVFETSHALKKNLPAIEQEIAKLFAANFQYEIQSGDDLAVWTVDESLHTGGFPLASWTPTDAGMEAKQLDDFLDHQKFARHASLEALQPVLNRVVKNSERLTVIIFCDSQSRLTGTPYDSGVNGIITNAAAKYKGGVAPFILVLRSYQGEYLGCSVNRTSTLSFPKFPPPPAPVPPSAPVATNVPPPAPPVSGPIVKPVPALIIVGTKSSTNLPPPAKVTPPPPTVPAAIIVSNPPPVILPAATNPPAAGLVPAPTNGVATPPASAFTPAPAPVAAPPPTAPPVASNAVVTAAVSPAPAKPAAVFPAAVPKAPAPIPEPVVTQMVASTLTPPSVPEAKRSDAGSENVPDNRGFLLPLVLGGVALAAAIALVSWLMIRSRRPHGSLITRSMLDEPPRPPRK